MPWKYQHDIKTTNRSAQPENGPEFKVRNLCFDKKQPLTSLITKNRIAPALLHLTWEAAPWQGSSQPQGTGTKGKAGPAEPQDLCSILPPTNWLRFAYFVQSSRITACSISFVCLSAHFAILFFHLQPFHSPSFSPPFAFFITTFMLN